MAVGTDAGLLEGPRPQSVYKHAILEQYVVRYATMTASKLPSKRSVLFDGFAGRGRFDTGEAASAEHMMLAAQKAKASTQIDIYLVEKNAPDFFRLDGVAGEYRQRGIRVATRQGECAEYLDEAIALSSDASLFLFLDPCGAVLPFDIMAPALHKRGTWPRTEVLMNFNADLIRRAGGQYKKGQLDLGGVAQADKVCGGEWWRDVALQAHLASGSRSWEASAEAVAHEYARRLTVGTSFHSVVAPVRRQVHHQPVYFLIFLTADPHGLWVFGAAAAKARERWLKALGPDPDFLEGMLFDAVEHQISREHEKAIATISDNISGLVADGLDKAVVQFGHEIFGDVYGEAKETAFTAALRNLVRDGRVLFVRKGSKPHQHIIRIAT
jgi:three-Cys-motif partner protein